MKKYIVFPAPVLILLISAGLMCASPDSFGQVTAKASKGIVIPADLNTIFTNSCMPCHCNEGKKLAKTMLNFSRWDKYSYHSQVQKSKAICRMVKKGEMPPAQFNESSPELALTPAQKEKICDWVNSVVVKK
jgi:hypothetical protein